MSTAMLRYLLSLQQFWFILFIWPRRRTTNIEKFPLVGRCHESDLGVPGPHVGSSFSATNTTGTVWRIWNHCMSRVKVLRQPTQTSQGQCAKF
ncbi:hypothetical protein EV363DRAFT_1346507, partial [Boletus edulis]